MKEKLWEVLILWMFIVNLIKFHMEQRISCGEKNIILVCQSPAFW